MQLFWEIIFRNPIANAIKRVDFCSNLEQWLQVVYPMQLIALVALVISKFAMRMKGLEPSRHKTLEPKSSASTNSATSAESQAYIQGVNSLLSNCLLWSQVDNFLEIEKGAKK